jgi:hypothetical protein
MRCKAARRAPAQRALRPDPVFVEIDCSTADLTVQNKSALQRAGKVWTGPGEGPSAQVNALNPVMSRPTRSVWSVSVPS